ncbi:MAG: hypothetical protein IH618_09565 [Ignavibacteriaceae bacterium]|nr:hypothetical protein [Ignavibacteriaceae bacterium]
MKLFIRFFLIIITVVYCSDYLYSQKPSTLDYPSAMTPGDWRFSLGWASISMPSDIVLESSVIRWPLIKFGAQMGLPSNFVMDAMLSTELLTNHIELGGRWVYEFNDNFHASAEYSLAYFFGKLEGAGYDTKIHGWFSYPSLGVGYDFGELTLTAIGTICFINSLTSTSGEVETSFNTNRFNGFNYRIALEQPFYKTTTIGLAFQLNYFKMYYPQWPLFPALDRYYWIPEMQIWLTL